MVGTIEPPPPEGERLRVYPTTFYPGVESPAQGLLVIVADDDVDPGQWFDPSYLGRMAGRAGRVSLGPYEKLLHDLVMPGR